ncbi:MAG: putative Ig domain-containing protein [Proteobacteria bacterium]|nr:putative Ig domain-containing protein [Pseudomonadota bacterium]
MSFSTQDNHHRSKPGRPAPLVFTWVGVCLILLVGGYVSSPDRFSRLIHTPLPLVERAPITDNDTVLEKVSSHPQRLENYAHLPLQFEQNRGQTADEVKYISRNSGYTLFLTPTETVLSLKNSGSGNQYSETSNNGQTTTDTATPSAIVRMKLLNANVDIELKGNNILPGKVNYLLGRDKANWLTDIPTYADVIAKDLYPGIDLRYHGDQQQLEYDFIVAPGTNTEQIKIQFDGIKHLTINSEGDLILETSQGELRHKKPKLYQDINGERVFIDGGYLLADNATVGFQLGEYDPNHELIIDPVLDYSTYLGGTDKDEGMSIAVDAEGNVIITGETKSTDFPLVNALQVSLSGEEDVFVAKLTADGSTLIYSTYLGGAKKDKAKGIAVDVNGNVTLTGETDSDLDFPLVDAIQSEIGGKKDAFISKLSSDGSSLLYSTYFGGVEDDKGEGIAVDALGNTYIVGITKSKDDFPLENAVQALFGGGDKDAFIAKIGTDNQSPEITSTPITTGIENQLYTYVVEATDADGDTLEFSLNSFPLGMTIDSEVGEIAWLADIVGNIDIEVEVNDGNGGTDTQTYTLTITTDNQAPTIISTPITEAFTDQIYTYDVEATDPDLDALNYALQISPVGMVINANTGVITWTPDTAGDFNVTVLVDDNNGGIDTQTYTVNVIQANRPPTITSTPLTDATVDTTYQHQIIATDPDEDRLTYTLTTAPLGMSINNETGFISWLPITAGDFQVVVNVDDNNGEMDSQTFQLTVNFSPGLQPPGLAPIGNQNAPLGSTLTIQLSATDPDGDPLLFTAEPIPLIENMTLDASSGLFTFRPALNQVGDHVITFIASDGRFTDPETITITVPAPGGVTRLLGQVLSTGGTPLENVRMEIDGVEAFTDINGNYLLDNLPNAGEVRLLIDGSTVTPALGTFATVPEMIPIITGTDNLLEPAIVLLPLDVASADPVTTSSTSIITSSRAVEGLEIFEPVTLTIPPNSAFNEADGTPFTGEIHISRVEDPTQGPRPLPPDIDLGYYIAIQPFGVVYPDPVPISFPNVEHFPPGSLLDFFALNHDTGEMEKIGEGTVSVDGETVDSIGGIVKSNSWHGIVPQAPVNEPAIDDKQGPIPPKDPQICPACRFNKESGNLGEDHTLPPYYSLGSARTVHLSYNSLNANPQPIINIESTFGNFAPPPESMSTRIKVGGIDQSTEFFSETLIAPSAIRGQFESSRPSIQFDASAFTTGIYDYDLTVNCHFPISRRSETLSGDVVVLNDINSPFGAGWSLVGLQRITINPEGLALVTGGDGTGLIFTPINVTNFESPAADFSVLIRNGDNSFTRRMKDGTLYNFDSNGRQTTRVDRNGNITTYTYDAEDQLTRITDPIGKEFSFTYFAGHIQRIRDPLGRTTGFEHDSEGNLITIIEPNGDEREFEYQPGKNLMTAQTDQRDNRTEYQYNHAGRIAGATLPDGSSPLLSPSSVDGVPDPTSGTGTGKENLAPPPTLVKDIENRFTDHNGNVEMSKTDTNSATIEHRDAVGRVTLTKRDDDSLPTETTRPNLSGITRTFDSLGNPTFVREEFNGAEYEYDYDQFSLVTSYTNPNDHTTTINRDALGNPEQIINHLGHTTTMEYDSRGLVERMVSPNGLETIFTYNIQGLPETETETPPAGSPGNVRITQYSYDVAGQLTETITPDGVVLTMIYDDKGRLTSIIDNLNQSIEYTYDPYNNLIQTDTSNADSTLALIVQQAFDTRNRLIEIRMPHNGTEDSITQRLLDNNSNLMGLIDPNGNSSGNVFDGEDRLTENTHRLSGITTYEYDTNDRITKVVAPNDVQTTYTYDVLGRRLTETSPDRGTIDYTYDLANNVTTITEGRGIIANMSYDELERVATKTYPNTLAGKNENVTYTYDLCDFGLGYLCTRVDESGTTDYNYDAYGNLTDSDFTEVEGTLYSMSYQYDDGDHITRMTMPSGRVVDYSRDGVRRVDAVDTTLNGNLQNIVSNIQYRGDNQITQCTFGNGLIDERNYDLQGRLSDQLLRTASSTLIDQRLYSYDKNSNILGINTNVENNAYTYDALDRIASDTIDTDVPIEFTYDLNDNRLTKSRQDLTLEEFFAHVERSNRLSVLETLQLGITPLENLSNRSMVYNDVGRLFQLMEEGILKAEYIYNDGGQRTRKTIYQADGITIDSITIYHYDQMGYLVTETDETGVLIKDYIWQEGMTPLAQIDNNAGTETITYLHIDHLMTNRLATDEFQSIVWRWEGEAFGNTPTQELSGVSVNLRFPGQYFDSETNLHYNTMRYYDPQLGRYITSDPVGLIAGLNTYSYARSNSIGLYDPDGQFIPLAIGAISLGISLYDAYNTLTDECLTPGEKAGRLILDAAIRIAGGALLKHGFKAFRAVAKGPLWSSTKGKSAVENAFGHFKKHKSEFPEFQNAKQYAEGTKKFLNNPPKGILTKTNSRGDTLRYDPNTNTFGVLSKDGAPRTMFRPKNGIDYWNKQ